MKIFLNLIAGSTGGQITRARAFMDRVDKFNPGGSMVVVKEKGVLGEYLSTPNKIIEDVAIPANKLKVVRRMWWENTSMTVMIGKYQPDVFLTFSHYLPLAHNTRIPSVVGVSNLAPFSPEAWEEETLSVRLRLIALKKSVLSSCRRASHVIALSDACRQVLCRCGIPSNKISVIPNGVDQFWSQSIKPTNLFETVGIVRPFILYVSHFYRYKNHIRLVDAYANLPGDIRKSFQLVLVGKPYCQSYYADICRRIDRLGLMSDVVLLPGETAENLRELYQLAVLFVFPSLIENSPNILLEAMRAGAPVLASSLPPMPEFGGGAAEYFDATDVDEITRKLTEMLVNPARLNQMRGLSSARADKFTWDDFVDGVVHQCRSAAGVIN